LDGTLLPRAAGYCSPAPSASTPMSPNALDVSKRPIPCSPELPSPLPPRCSPNNFVSSLNQPIRSIQQNTSDNGAGASRSRSRSQDVLPPRGCAQTPISRMTEQPSDARSFLHKSIRLTSLELPRAWTDGVNDALTLAGSSRGSCWGEAARLSSRLPLLRLTGNSPKHPHPPRPPENLSATYG
jgi:hypothetical protein